MLREIEMRKKQACFKDAEVQTIYFGGGTPSLLTKDEITVLIDAVKHHFKVLDTVEITLECNPDDATLERLIEWKKLGIHRLSIGIQSFNNEQLKWMNRTHNAKEAQEVIGLARSVGFAALTVDLMYGLPNLSLEDWRKQLKAILKYELPHISAYCLTVEPKTALAKWVRNKEISIPTTDEQAQQFLILQEVLTSAGYEQYEISNFARDNNYSKHNTSYWKGIPYIGIGPSAHGFSGNIRYWNCANNQEYIKQLEKGILPEEVEELTVKDQFNERIMIGLRTQWGVSVDELQKLLPITDKWKNEKEKWKNSKDLIEENNQLILTEKGRLLADHIAAQLFV